MRILGIDPGLNATGYGVIATSQDRIEVVAAGAITPSARQPLAQRLLHLYDALTDIIRATTPELTVLESSFTHHRFVTTSAMMAHARSVALVTSAQQRLAVVEYLPTRIKKALTGYGAASKEQVARAVGMWIGARNRSWSSDTTDALALAIAHAHIGQTEPLMRSYRPAARGRRPELPPSLAAAIVEQSDVQV